MSSKSKRKNLRARPGKKAASDGARGTATRSAKETEHRMAKTKAGRAAASSVRGKAGHEAVRKAERTTKSSRGRTTASGRPEGRGVSALSNARIAMRLNGEDVEVSFAPYKTLLEVLREDLGLMGTKHGCELGECGACAVLLDGEPVLSCLVLALECGGRDIVTVEGLDRDGKLHPLQDSFADLGGAQCGYCTPGILVTAKALLDRHPDPTRGQIQEAISGNLCRCTGYLQIVEAVEDAALRIRTCCRESADHAKGPPAMVAGTTTGGSGAPSPTTRQKARMTRTNTATPTNRAESAGGTRSTAIGSTASSANPETTSRTAREGGSGTGARRMKATRAGVRR